MYFRRDLDMLDAVIKSKPQLAAMEQRKMAVAGDVLKLGGIQFLVLQAGIIQAKYHHAAWTGGMTKPQLKTASATNEGFGIQFVGTDIRLPFTWKKVIERSTDVLFFSPPLDQSRHYHEMF